MQKRFDGEGKLTGEKKGDIMDSFIRHGLNQEQAEQESLVSIVMGRMVAAI